MRRHADACCTHLVTTDATTDPDEPENTPARADTTAPADAAPADATANTAPDTASDITSVRTALRAAIVDAMRSRDREAAATYRTALAAIDNAEAVPATQAPRDGAIESASLGVGVADAPRRTLTELQMRGIVAAEADALRKAAQAPAPRADSLRREADRLRRLLAALP